MSRALRHRPSPAMVISLIALFVALAGTAYALDRNSVKSKHIVNGQVKTQDLANGAVSFSKLGPDAFKNQLGALVRQNSTTDCTLIRGRGAVDTSSNAMSNFCTVNFNRNIDNCVYTAGLTSTSTGYPGADAAGEVWAFASDADSIAVRTANSAGSKNAQDFAIVVVC